MTTAEAETAATGGASPRPGKLNFAFAPGQKVTVFGHSGTGKTTLCTGLLGGVPWRCPVVAVDPKNHLKPPSAAWQIVRELPRNWERLIAREKHPQYLRLIVRPFPEGGSYPGSKVRYGPLNEIYDRIWNASYSTTAGRDALPHEKITVYLDDLQELTDEHRASAELRRLWNMGRARLLSPWLSTLRPSRVPREAFAEADHMMMFWVRDREDRKRASELMGEHVVNNPGPGPYDFYYLPPGVGSTPILVNQGHEGEQWGAGR